MLRKLWPNRLKSDREAWVDLLATNDLKPENSLDETFGIYDGDMLVATASYDENILKCIAIRPEHRGGAVFNELMSEMTNKLFQQGHHDIFLYTKPESYEAFTHIGFKVIESVADKLVFMERSMAGIRSFIAELEKHKAPLPKDAMVGSIVMNANPFTQGHRALVEKASRECDHVYLFVLSEDRSLFPAATRMQLVQAGTRDLGNLTCLETGPYLVSSKTFPAYFLKEDEEVVKVQATLDAKIFKHYFAPALDIRRRYLGTEPISRTTALYNEAMLEVFDGSIEVVILPRVEANAAPISASRVRELLKDGNLEAAKMLLPPTTAAFLDTEEGAAIIEKAREN